MPVCPSCGGPLDPIHAPVARIRGGRVLSFCSSECANAGPRAPEESVGPSASKLVPAASQMPVVDEPAAVSADNARDQPQPPRSPRPLRPETSTPVSVSRRSGKRRTRILLVASVIMLGGMAVAIIPAVSPSSPTDVGATERPGRPVVAPPVEASAEPETGTADAQVESATLRRAALELLRELRVSESPRVARLAAMALARVGDPEALGQLRGLLDSEESDLLKIEIATALARAGDENGRAQLVNGLRASRRDVRLDAAGALVALGDDSGRAALRQMMSIRSHRIGAAGLLARLGDEEGLEVLREELESKNSSQENRMRAAVALGRAGDESVRDQLKQILDDRRYKVGAADALAALGDKSSVEALESQLSLTAMRVPAASALVRLGAEVDLSPLAIMLTTGDEVSRVTAAECLLILTGDESEQEQH